ncbi:MAG: hypothetical protein AB7K71_31085 [Polyangiaceae bacterium]
MSRRPPSIPPSQRSLLVGGPGLVKTSGIPRPSKRSFELWLCPDYWWRDLFEHADVMSEGATRTDPGPATYFGTTSILLPSVEHGGRLSQSEIEICRPLAARDVHARVRAIRIACREAEVRAGVPLRRIRAELTAVEDARGLRLDVEIEAPLAGSRGVRKTRPTDAKRSAKRGGSQISTRK